MFGIAKKYMNVMQATVRPLFAPPKRHATQVGMIVSTPPRVPVSKGEQLVHILFIYVVWLTPVAYFLSQLKVWRREYLQS